LKKLKINYLLIGIVTLLLAVALWPSIPWFGKAENRIAAIQERGELRVSTLSSPLIYDDINGKTIGLDYELAQLFADYLGVKLKVTVRQNINQLLMIWTMTVPIFSPQVWCTIANAAKIISRARLITLCRSRWFIVWVACARAHWPT